MESGFRLPWENDPAPLTPAPIFLSPPADLQAVAVLQSEIDTLLIKEAVEEVFPPYSPGFYGRIFVVPKVTGGWRPVLDLSPLNRFLRQVRFRMETPTSVREAIFHNDWAASLDLRDAYFHVLIHPRFRQWLRFTWGHRVFQFRALPFGLSLSPWVFTRVSRELALSIRRRGIRLRMYLDDWLVLGSSQEICSQHLQTVMSAARSLGFELNLAKSDLHPSQQFEFLGMQIDTVTMMVRPASRRLERLHRQLTDLRHRPNASARQLTSLLGSMESLAALVPLGRLHKRPFQRALSLRWSQSHQSWSELVSLGEWFLTTTSQWLDRAWLTTGVPLVPLPPLLELYTDASNHGWGAHVADQSASGTWSPSHLGLHINLLEMEAVSQALQSFQSLLAGKPVLLCTDNTTVACYINKQGGARSSALSLRAEAILARCWQADISLSARHVPGKLNIVADALSRPHMILATEWTLAHEVLRPVWRKWFTPQVDLFATRFSHRLPVYMSPVPDPAALAVDALAQDWSRLVGYAYPPFPILGKVIRKARLESATLILVAPLWPAQPWFPDLTALSHVAPMPLQVGPRGLLQPRSGIPHGNPQLLNLHAWLLCGGQCAH